MRGGGSSSTRIEAYPGIAGDQQWLSSPASNADWTRSPVCSLANELTCANCLSSLSSGLNWLQRPVCASIQPYSMSRGFTQLVTPTESPIRLWLVLLSQLEPETVLPAEGSYLLRQAFQRQRSGCFPKCTNTNAKTQPSQRTREICHYKAN